MPSDKNFDEQLMARAILDLELKLKHEIRQNSALKLAKIEKNYQNKEKQLVLIEEKIDSLITNREEGKLKKKFGWTSKTSEYKPQQCFYCGKHGHLAKSCLYAGGCTRGNVRYYPPFKSPGTSKQSEKEQEEGKLEVNKGGWTSQTAGTYTDEECETSDDNDANNNNEGVGDGGIVDK